MPTVKETFDLMPSKFKAANAAGINKTIQYEISGDGGGTWHGGYQGRRLHGQLGPGGRRRLDRHHGVARLARHDRR